MSFFLIAAIASCWNSLSGAGWNSHSGIEYDNKSSDSGLSRIKEYPEPKTGKIEEVEISFRMRPDSALNYSNVFQTAPGNSGIRMELGGSSKSSLGMVVGDGDKGFRGISITDHVELGTWHSVRVSMSEDKRIRVFLDGNRMVDQKYGGVDYIVSDIAVGAGFSKTRAFDGEIRDFAIKYKFFQEGFHAWLTWVGRLLWSFVAIYWALKSRRKLRRSFQILSERIQALPGKRIAKHARLYRGVAIGLFSVLPAVLVLFSLYKLYADAHFLNTLHPNTVLYLGSFLLGSILIILFFDRPSKSMLLLVLLAPFLMILAGKYLALLGLCTFILACLALGFKIYGFFEHREIDMQKMSFALLCGLAVNSYLVWAAIHFPVNFPVVYYLFFAGEIILFRRILTDNVLELKDKIRRYHFTPAQQALAALMLFHLAYVLVPNYLWDDLVAHFYIPKVVWLNGAFNFNPRYPPPFFNISLISLGCNSSLFLMGGEYAIRLFYWLILYVGLFLVESFTRKRHGERIGLWTTLTLATTPYFLWQIGANFIDTLALFSAAVIFIHFCSLLEEVNPKRVGLFFALACFALAGKLQAIFLILPTAAGLLWLVLADSFKKKSFSILGFFGLGLLGAGLFFAPLFLHNWVIAQNPVFPLYNDVFKSPYYEIVKPLPGFFRFKGAELRWDTLYDITFGGAKYYVGGNMEFLFGFSYFVFLPFFPLLFLYRRNGKEVAFTGFAFVAAVLLCYFITGPQMRYFSTSAPLGAMLIGLIMGKLVDVNASKRTRYWTHASFFAVFAMNLVCQVHNTFLPSPYPIKEAITGNYAASPRLKQWQEVKEFFAEMNRRYDGNTKALLYYSPAMYFADFKIEVLDWYNHLTVMEILVPHKDLEGVYDRVFQKQKFDFLIITDERPKTFLDEFISRGMVRKEYSRGGYNLYVPARPRG